jgi:hypothetical protein
MVVALVKLIRERGVPGREPERKAFLLLIGARPATQGSYAPSFEVVSLAVMGTHRRAE